MEFDTDKTAVINPTHEKLDLKLPKKCVFAFLGEYIDEYAGKTETRKASEFVSATKLYPIYITKYKGKGCSVVEMECSALAAVCAFRGVTRGMIFYTADNLANVDKYDKRNWGASAYEYALTLCLDAVLKL